MPVLRFGRVGALAFTLLLVGGGCGGGPDGPSQSAFEEQYLQGYCERIIECDLYSIGTLAAGDVDTCLAMLEARGWLPYRLARLTEALAAGTTEYRASNAKQCLEALETATCAELYNMGYPDPICARVFLGQLDNGEECFLDQECQGGYCSGNVLCPGTCGSRTADGATCGSTPCLVGSHCERLTNECTPLPGGLVEGDPCGVTTIPCGLGLMCSETLHECVPRGGEGAPCDNSGECLDGYVCRSQDQLCTAISLVSQDGGACGEAFNGDYCDLSAGLGCTAEMTGGVFSWTTCVALGTDGDPCFEQDTGAGTASTWPCDGLAGLFCPADPTAADTASCEPLRPGGADCNADTWCESGVCVSSTSTCLAVGDTHCP